MKPHLGDNQSPSPRLRGEGRGGGQLTARSPLIAVTTIAAISFGVVATGCEPAYVPTIAPKDAKFTAGCVAGCGDEGRDEGILIDVTFYGRSRQISVCCNEREALAARLQTIEDMWCDGLDVPPKKIGSLTVATTVSEATGKRGATIDQGEGYVSFNCDAWLGELIDKLLHGECCDAAPAATTAPEKAPASSNDAPPSPSPESATPQPE